MRHAWLLAPTLLLAVPAQADPLAPLELPLSRTLNTLGAPALDGPMSWLSNSYFLVASPVALAIAADPGHSELPLLTAGSELVAAGVVAVLKPLVGRDRPYMTDPTIRIPAGNMDYDPRSFPSGHAAVSFAGATAIADARPDWALPAYLLAGLITYSRLYNGVHYPSDVVAGALVGITSARLVHWGYASLPVRLSSSGLTGASLAAGPALSWSTAF